ncbi:MAG: plastocyanin/azurin family copper-binding protein [Candidatus Pacearchaeota archaeon]|nr:plastocyanin/azurin family copper-binding protein [Candidatus Pacearchaeota archaeon]
MKNKNLIIGTIILFFIIIGVAYFFIQNNSKYIPTQDIQSSEEINVEIEIKNFEFIPGSVTVKKGTIVTWTNLDSAKHTATSDEEGVFDSGLLSKDESWSYTFNEIGSFGYYCIPHPFMTGTIEVVEND